MSCGHWLSVFTGDSATFDSFLSPGIGYGLMFGPSLVMIGMYFDKRRSLANGLAAAGGSLGQLVLPQLITVLIEHYAFSGLLFHFSRGVCLPVKGSQINDKR